MELVVCLAPYKPPQILLNLQPYCMHMQEDALPPVLTANEVVQFHAALCTDVGRGNHSTNQRTDSLERAQAALSAMRLTQQSNTMVSSSPCLQPKLMASMQLLPASRFT